MVFCMDSFARDLRNVEWELFLLYRSGSWDVERVEFLWGEVERLEALL